MTDDAQPPRGPASEGVFGIDEATAEIARLDERPEDEATEGEQNTAGADEPEADEESDAEPTAEDSDADPDDGATDDAEDEDDETEADDSPPIQAPHSWDQEAKERFAKLDRETQEYLVDRENERDRVVWQKLNEAAEARKKVEAESSKLEEYSRVFDQVLHQAQERFSDRWKDTDWRKLAQEQPAEYVRLKAEFDADQQTLQHTQRAQQAAEQEAHAEFLQREEARLKEVAPELAQSPERRAELGKYLLDQGVDQDALRWASAGELSLAYKAMMYDRLKAQPAKPKPPPSKPAPKAVKPAAEAKSKPRKAKRREAAMKRLAQTGSIEDATAAILALDED